MSDLDELKLKYTEENPDKPSDDVETIAFHSTPRKPKPAPKAVGPKRAKAGTLMHPVTAPVLHDMERRFGLTVVDVSAGGHVRFMDSEGRLREGVLRVYGRRATMFDGDGGILSA